MSVSAPPEAPRSPLVEEPPDSDAQEALIEEARQRTRRRRVRYASSAFGIGVIAVAVFGFGHRGGGGARQSGASAAPSAPAPITRLPARANGVLAIEVRQDGAGVINPDTLAVINPDGSGLRPLTRCPATPGGCFFGMYAWSPDGKRLAFLAGHVGGAITASNLFLYVVNSDGTDRRRLARCGNCDTWQNLSWSPDSRRIVFGTGGDLDIVSVASGAQRRLAVSGMNPVWSPAGTRIAFAFGNALYSIRPYGSGMARVANTPGGVADPAWAPDGTKIAFDSADAIYVVDADGSHLRLLVGGAPASGPGTPSWSPRGDHILYFNTPRVPGGFSAEVWIMKPDGSGRQRLYHSRQVGVWSPPIWSPDGKAIALAKSVDTANGIIRNGILVMDAQGKHQRRLLGNPDAIAWQSIPR